MFYAFDPRRSAILLIGGDKTGDDRFYERMIPIADQLYEVYIAEIGAFSGKVDAGFPQKMRPLLKK